MDCITDPETHTVVFMKPAQVGWTEILCNITGYFIDQDPCPMLNVQPTLGMAQTWSKDRLTPMLRDTPVLHGKVRDARSRDAENTTLHKKFDGGHLTIIGANSPSGLASRPIRIVMYDETDRYPESAGTEGDPIALGRKRTTTFWNRKILMGSTPTVKGASRIEMAYEETDMRRFHVPCPHCGEHQVLEFKHVKFDKTKPDEAVYVCPYCGSIITDQDKPGMLSRGKWVAQKPFKGAAGFWINGLYSPWLRFGEIASEFMTASKTPETLQVFVNTVLAETWVEIGDVPKWEDVAKLREPYGFGVIPAAAKVLTAGVDVQKDRLVYAVRAWGGGQTSWLVEHGELWGETDKMEVWGQLNTLLDRDFGDGMMIRRMLIDSGYRPEMTYAFCRQHPQAFPSKGRDDLSKPVSLSKIDVRMNGNIVKGGLALWHIDTGYFKSWIHSRIKWPVDQVGAWKLSEDATDDYCRQIVAESKIIMPNGKVTWKRHERDNHYLDCEVLNAAAAHMLGVRMLPSETQKNTPQNSSNSETSAESAPTLADRQIVDHTRHSANRRGGYLSRSRNFLKR